MKIFYEGSVYVHTEDLAELARSDLLIPRAIYLAMGEVPRLTEANRYTLNKFDNGEVVDFFRRQDWILDFDEVEDYSEAELIDYKIAITIASAGFAREYNHMTDNEQRESGVRLMSNCSLLSHKARSAEAFRQYRLGVIDMDFPEEISVPRWCEPGGEVYENVLGGYLQMLVLKIKRYLLLIN